MKKKMIIGSSIVIFFMVVLISITLYLTLLSSPNPVKAQTEKNVSQKMLTELQKEQQLLEKERKRLEEYERNLKAFEAELEQKYTEYLRKAKELEGKEKIFNERVQDKMVDRQTIETYENIDPEQAAILMKNLYIKDTDLAVLIMRKIAGKKAGKILEAMIPLDKEISTQLAKESLDYYKPE
jgi:flagellar motility protein MotE (MotC chaperone)